MSFRLLCFCLTGSIVAFVSAPVGAQDQDNESGESKRVVAGFVTTGGFHRYRSGHWGDVTVDVANATDQPTDVDAVTWFRQDPGLQFARRVTIPPHSRRMTTLPILAPAGQRPETPYDFNSMLIDSSSDSNAMMQDSGGDRIASRALLHFGLGAPPSLVISDGRSGERQAIDVVVAMRQGDNRSVVEFDMNRLPTSVQSLDAVNHLVLIGDRLADDATALAAVRTWVRTGGRLWLMLDRVDPATAEAIFGERFPFEFVDRVTLTEIPLQQLRPAADEISAEEYEAPIPFVRGVVDRATVTHQVGAWPAAFWFPFGRGRVMCTTLGGRAWVRPNSGGGGAGNSKFATTSGLQTLSGVMLATLSQSPVAPEQLTQIVSERIGYRIPSRTGVACVMVLFCAVVPGIGVWLRRREQTGKLTWLIPLASVAAVLPLVMLGAISRGEIPDLAVAAQVLEFEPDFDEQVASGVLGFYDADGQSGRIGSESGGVFIPDRSGVKSTRWRMLWSDAETWEWVNMALPTGVRMAEAHPQAIALQGVEAVVTFDSEGLAGTIHSGDLGEIADVVVATRSVFTLPVSVGSDGVFSASPDQALPPGEFLDETLISDVQRVRQEIYRGMFDTKGRDEKYPVRPTLFGWCQAAETGFRYSDQRQTAGQAMAVIPINIRRPPAGTRMQIPSPFIPYRAVRDARTKGYSSAFRSSLGIWAPSSSAGSVTLRFQLPPELLPVSLNEALLRVRIRAPMRSVAISSGAYGDDKAVKDVFGPVEVVEATIADSEALRLDDRGGLHVVITLGELKVDREELKSGIQDENWLIDWIDLRTTATTD